MGKSGTSRTKWRWQRRRKVFPACESMYVCCPALRSRSRQPIKHCKKLLSEISPKSPVKYYEKYVKPKDVVGAEEVKSSDEKLSEDEYAASDDEEIAGK
ncbi:hypothetical protein PVK06_005337 [Gossypium arboreum]|uniref:Uncharacterized protein n=1 Tax=Gossypium arboreum TaxID=29729 RepID=A0ABR0QVM2_GOSAR|nr:hypothetical protein PVK06_005337 [Gossypium arboreum]